MKLWACAIVCLAAAASAWAQPGTTTLWLWSQPDSRQVVVILINAQGLRIAEPGQPVSQIGWHEIRQIEGPEAGTTAEFLKQGRTVWRALARIDRGDFVTAEPMLEQAADDLAPEPGPTARAVWLGLMKCRRSRLALESAAGAWLHALRATSPSSDAPGYALLIAELPPIWTPAGARAFLRHAPSVESTATVPEAIISLYDLAAQDSPATGALAQLLDSIPPTVAEHDAVRLVSAMLAAELGDTAQRAAARQRLRDIAAQGAPRWVQAWASLAIGRSMLSGSDPEQQLLGVAELLRVPATLPDASPVVTAMALRDASAAMAELGYSPAARAMMDQLSDLYPELLDAPSALFSSAPTFRRTTPAQGQSTP